MRRRRRDHCGRGAERRPRSHPSAASRVHPSPIARGDGPWPHRRPCRFEALQNDEGATLVLEAEDGTRVELDATFEQLELMADTLDDILSANDDTTEVKDEEEA